MLEVRVESDVLRIGKHVTINFQRTLRIPDDGRTYPLPPGLGNFPIRRIEDYKDRVPEAWRTRGGVMIPMYQREALWLSFMAANWRPNALKVAVGKVNALTGGPWSEALSATPQDYMVVPNQPWLDGINAGDGFIRQFVAMPLGMGYTVEGQVTGAESHGGIQLVVFDPKPGKFPDNPPPQPEFDFAQSGMRAPAAAAAMGVGAGGKMKQSIYPDRYGIDTWDESCWGRVFVHIVNSMDWRAITGEEPPPTPVDARTYTKYGLPWFDLYDEHKGDLAASGKLAKVKSIKELDAQKGFGTQRDDQPVAVEPQQVVAIKDASHVTDGEW